MSHNFIKKRFATTFFLFGGIILFACFAGCTKEKGCTDKNALNYNSVAEENDGSCTYCKDEVNQIGDRAVYLVDQNWSSQHYNETVARFNLKQFTKTFNDQKCGKDECAIAVTLTSLVNEQMEFSYSIQISNMGGSPTSYALINGMQTMTEDSIVNSNSFNCESIDNSSINVYLSSGNIIYH